MVNLDYVISVGQLIVEQTVEKLLSFTFTVYIIDEKKLKNLS